MKRKIISIDWEKKFNRLKPYFSGEGGLICVNGAPGSARRIFLKLVKFRLKAANENITIIHLNPDYTAESRTMSEILDKLERSLGPKTNAPVGKMEVIRDVNAGGDVNIENLRISQTVGGGAAGPETYSRLRDIAANLNQKKPGERTAIILEDCHKTPESQARRFWEDFWGECLESMTEKGFLLICACESPNRICAHARFNIMTDYTAYLTNQYNEREFKIALQDIAMAIHEKTGKRMKEARSMADMLLRSNRLNPSDVYTGLNFFFFLDLEEVFDG